MFVSYRIFFVMLPVEKIAFVFFSLKKSILRKKKKKQAQQNNMAPVHIALAMIIANMGNIQLLAGTLEVSFELRAKSLK